MARVVAASAAELFIWRGARGVGSPLHITSSHLSPRVPESPNHTFPPEPGLQSLSEWQIPTVVLWEGGKKLYSQSLNVATQRGVMPLPILGIPKFFTELALARVEVEAACSQEDQQLGVVYAPTTLTNTYNNILKYMLKL